MIVPKQSKAAIQKLWMDYENYLMQIFESLLKVYVDEIKPSKDQFEAAKQQVEFLARKQTIIDIKKVLSGTYEKN